MTKQMVSIIITHMHDIKIIIIIIKAITELSHSMVISN